MALSLGRRFCSLAATFLVIASLASCTLRDAGWDRHALGLVSPDARCGPAIAGCPPCALPDGAACRDRFYPTGHRCGAPGDGLCEAIGATCSDGLCLGRDDDRNGLDDDLERDVAQANLPLIALAPDEHCGAPRAIVYRVRRHPDAPRRLAIAYVVLYDRDCGSLNGHLGDNEAFAITVDLNARPGAAATVGVMAQAHRGTLCESTSTCSSAPGSSACGTSLPPSPAQPGGTRVVIYSSRDKHSNYLDVNTCLGNCVDACTLGPPLTAPLLDVGQPDFPLVHDLTDANLILGADGWELPLLHFDPWSTGLFGGAGYPRDQLLNFVAPTGD